MSVDPAHDGGSDPDKLHLDAEDIGVAKALHAAESAAIASLPTDLVMVLNVIGRLQIASSSENLSLVLSVLASGPWRSCCQRQAAAALGRVLAPPC